ncbi:MAG: metal-dependent transcriptional regulator [Chloroflexi bacterium]|nr:metal-dependent transcriptional regulator [Chloroflexota bacterium]
MNRSPLSESVEMYLKALVELSDREMVAIGRLADRLGVTAVSANEMVKRLGEQGLVKHTPYKGVALTKKGRDAACNILRRQRLWECFLYDHLKIEWTQLYEYACSLEHATAPEVTEALAAFLGNPQTCPRGNPIPAADGSFAPLNGIPLGELDTGRAATILAVNATATEVIKHLYDRNLLPGHKVTVLEAAPLQGPLTLRVDGKDVALGLALAEYIIVSR